MVRGFKRVSFGAAQVQGIERTQDLVAQTD